MANPGRPKTEVPTGTVLHRVHAETDDPRFYGKRDGTWRYDDPEGQYGVMYVGPGQIGPFAETLLRQPKQKELAWSQVEKRRWARFETIEPLELADLHGEGVSWHGATVAEIAADHDEKTYPGAYETCQKISRDVHENTDLDGVQYRSRFDPSQMCIALFDRADHKIRLVEQGVPIDRDWVDGVIEPRGKHVVDV